MSDPDQRTALYRLYDENGRLLYVGVTANLGSRLGAHRYGKSWWPEVSRAEVEWHATRAEALQAEVAAIRDERPVHNKALPDDSGVYRIGVGRPKWIPPDVNVAERIDKTVALVREYQDIEAALWTSVEDIRAAGVPDTVLCEATGISRSTLHRRLGSRETSKAPAKRAKRTPRKDT